MNAPLANRAQDNGAAAAVPEMRPHRRQFVVGPEPMRPYDDWVCHQLGDVWLSHCPALPVSVSRDADGCEWAILGRALQTAGGQPDPPAQVAALKTAQMCEAHQSWAGRWALLGNGQVHPDGGALLGIYHAASPDGRTWASSSPALIASLAFGAGNTPPMRRRLLYEVGLHWFGPPCGGWEGITRLLPSQVFDLGAGAVRPRPLLPAMNPRLEYDAAISSLREAMISALQSLARQAGQIWVSLSAGYDSRVVLSMVVAARIEARIFTRITPRTSLADRRLPRELAAVARLPHRYVRAGRLIEARRETCMVHTAGHVSAGDADPLLRGARDELEGVLLGGWCIESGNGFVKRARLPAHLSDPEEFFAALVTALGEPPGGAAAGELRRWLDWAIAHPHAGLGLRDRLHIEQRIAGWMSSKEQLNDLSRVERLSIFNCARNYATLMAIPDDKRAGKTYGRDLVRLAAPQLAEFPFNPPDSHWGVAAALAHQLGHPVVALQRGGRRMARVIHNVAGHLRGQATTDPAG